MNLSGVRIVCGAACTLVACGGGGSGATTVHYVEAGQPVAGAPVLVSSLEGDTEFSGQTDARGTVVLDLEDDALVTVQRTPVLTVLDSRPSPELFSRIVTPGQEVTVGSTVPAVGDTVARLYPTLPGEVPSAFMYVVDGGSGPAGQASASFPADIQNAGIPVSADAVERGRVTLLAEAIDNETQISAYSMMDVDLQPIADGATSMDVTMPAWKSDFDQVSVTATNLDVTSWVAVGTSLWHGGARYFGQGTPITFPGQPAPSSASTMLHLPPGFADGLEIDVSDYRDPTVSTFDLTSRTSGAPGNLTFDVAGSAPSPCQQISLASDSSQRVVISWDGGDSQEDGVDVTASQRMDTSDARWRVVLPAGTTSVVLPELPDALANFQISINATATVRVVHRSLSAAADYDSLLDSITAGLSESFQEGDTSAYGSCSRQIDPF